MSFWRSLFMGRLKRWNEIYDLIRCSPGKMTTTAVYLGLRNHPSSCARSLSGVFADLNRMAKAGWLIRNDIIDEHNRERFGWTVNWAMPPSKRRRSF